MHRSVIVISDSAKFATAGTVIVVALILSALVNYLYIAEGNLTLFNSSREILLAEDLLACCSVLFFWLLQNRFHGSPLKLWSGEL